MGHTDLEDVIVNCTGRRFDSIEGLFLEAARCLSVPCRLQIGSYTCGNYFLGLLKRLGQGSLPGHLGEYDVVFPILSERQLDEFLPQQEAPIIQNARAVVVNDLGMLRLFRDRQGVRLGRLLFRDHRDHRYPAREEDIRPKSDALISALLRLGYKITAFENELLSEDDESGAGLEIPSYVHFPYRQVSCGHICEFASIGKPVEEKFVSDAPCSFQCFHVRLRHGEDYLKVGRNIFDTVPECWLSAERRRRIIYTPRW